MGLHTDTGEPIGFVTIEEIKEGYLPAHHALIFSLIGEGYTIPEISAYSAKEIDRLILKEKGPNTPLTEYDVYINKTKEQI